MISNSDIHSSVSSLNTSLSIKDQTKGKFDALLKASIHQKRSSKKSQSKEQLLNDEESTTASTENLLDKNNIDIHNTAPIDEQNKSYILNKFFDGHTSNKTTDIFSVEVQNENVGKPVPKPRKKKALLSHADSQATFEITSPEFVKNSSDKSPQSNATYNVEEIGDVLIHKSPLHPKIIIKDNSNLNFLEKGDTEILSDHDESKSEEEKATSHNVVEVEEEDASKKIDVKKTKKKKQEEISDELTEKKVYTYEKIVQISILKTDRLQLSSLVVHPVVKIHVIDVATGKYFPKSDKSRSVVFFYENAENDYISPVMTHAYNLQEKRILYPAWQEDILLNEDFEYLKNESHRIILFFEILDFVSFSTLHQTNRKDLAKGWHNIAFAFLRLNGKNGHLNVGKNLRLQLYYSYQSKKNDPHICNAWTWWKKKKLKKYPSTLYVNIKSVISPTKVVETFRSKTPVQRETSSKTRLCDDLQTDKVTESGINNIPLTENSNYKNVSKEDLTWSRRPNETCKLHNKCLISFNSGDYGCFVMKFSSNGKYLACAVQNENLFYIVVYSLSTLNEVTTFLAHQALIYDIKWSKDDAFLLSASADNTVSVYNFASSSFSQILPHPSFVYSCDISHEKVIATGCFDSYVRIWRQSMSEQNKREFHLFQELEGHRGYITSLCFSKKCSLFSADSVGVVIEWQKEKDWVLKREITLLDLKETIINHIKLFPKEKKLLIHSRDNTIRIIDVKSGCILQWLHGIQNKRYQIFSTISPCGTYVYSGSENGFVHVWNSKNGHEIAAYVPFSSDQLFLTIHCVEYNPLDNIIAISHYGKKLPILVYCYDKDVEQTTLDLRIKENELVETNDSENLKELKFKRILKRNRSLIQKGEKPDFKSVLQKMDLVITSQKK